MRIFSLLLLAAVAMAMTSATTFKVEAFTAEIPDDNKAAVRLTWTVSGEDEVDSYILWRQAVDQASPKQIHEAEVKTGPEPVKKYTFDDNSLYKADQAMGQQVTYILQVKYKSGRLEYPPNNQTKLTYTSTTIRRTWGSIKAMFQ